MFSKPGMALIVHCSFISSTEANTSQEIGNHVLVVFIVKAANLNPIRKIMARGQNKNKQSWGRGCAGHSGERSALRGAWFQLPPCLPELREASSHGAPSAARTNRAPCKVTTEPGPRSPFQMELLDSRLTYKKLLGKGEHGP